VREAIDLPLEGLLEDGGDLPTLRAIAAHQANPDYAGGTWALGEIDTTKFAP